MATDVSRGFIERTGGREAEVLNYIADELRHAGLSVEPEALDEVVGELEERNARPTRQTVRTAVNAVRQRRGGGNRVLATFVTPKSMDGSGGDVIQVVGDGAEVREFVTPRSLDGKEGGDVIRVTNVRPQEQRYAAIKPYFESAENVQDTDRQTWVWIKSNGPAWRLKMQLRALLKLADDGHSSQGERDRARAQAEVVSQQLDQMTEDFKAGRRDAFGNPAE